MGIKKLFKNLVLMIVYPRPLIGLIYLPKYIWHWIRYSKLNQDKPIRLLDAHPCLGDWVTTTPFDPHYFYQAAWLSRQLATSIPARHLDIGSDVKLIGSISAFLPIEFMDYRPLKVVLPGLQCTAGDILNLPMQTDSLMSLSCLHVVEHIGLGRYGDPIDPNGSKKAMSELRRVISPGGRLYLSVPVGRTRTCFNAHRVFSPEEILLAFDNFELVSFSMVNDDGHFFFNCLPTDAIDSDYSCGMFVFQKHNINYS